MKAKQREGSAPRNEQSNLAMPFGFDRTHRDDDFR
jgi:hypothetical protein